MRKESIAVEEAAERLVPVVLIAAEAGAKVDEIVLLLDEEVVVDPAGIRSVPVSAARRYFDEAAEWKARHDEKVRRIQEETPKIPVLAGVPAKEGAGSALESMMMSSDWVSPRDEFGRPKPNFLADELAEGQRLTREAENAVAEKNRLRDEMREALQ